MPALFDWTRSLLRHFRGEPRIVWHPEYRLPSTSLAARSGLDPRRPELVRDALVELGVVTEAAILSPERAGWDELGRVHTPAWLEAITQPGVLAELFAVEPWDVPTDAMLESLRRAVGGTMLAARSAVATPGPVLNLSGGFHHARPDGGGGFCALNDVAVALAALREKGFAGRVRVVDVDAHPPDGLAACLGPTVWIGSLSGMSWAAPAHVDETHLPPGTGDHAYLAALAAMLARMPPAELTFVIAGGDVREGDRMGNLALTEAGVRQRDAAILAALAGGASVWLPGGGYRADAWRVTAGTALVLARSPKRILPSDFDPMRARFRRVSAGLGSLFDDMDLRSEDLDALLGPHRDEAPRVMGLYSRAAVELALERFGVSATVRRLGYGELRALVDRVALGDRFRLYGTARGVEHLLAESVLDRGRIAGEEVLFVHWLTLRHPLGAWKAGPGPLPGQEVPGLGLAREAGELHRRIAERLGLPGVAMRPSWLHVAWACRQNMHFVSPQAQGEFEALFRDLGDIPLPELSRLATAGGLLCNGQRWRWEAPELVEWLQPRPLPADEVDAVRAASRFSLAPSG